MREAKQGARGALNIVAVNARAHAELLFVAVALVLLLSYTNQQAAPDDKPTKHIQAEFQTIAKTYEAEQYGAGGMQVRMQRALSITKDAHVEAVIFSNNGDADASVSLLVIIPKRLAGSIDEVRISAPDIVVVERDPVVRVTYRIGPSEVKFLEIRPQHGGDDVSAMYVLIPAALGDGEVKKCAEALKPLADAQLDADAAKAVETEINKRLGAGETCERAAAEAQAAAGMTAQKQWESVTVPSASSAALSEAEQTLYDSLFAGVEDEYAATASELVPGAIVEFGIAPQADAGMPLLKPIEGELGAYASVTVKESEGGYNVKILFDLRELLAGGRISRDEVEGVLPITFASAFRLEKRVRLKLRIAHVNPDDFVVVSPKRLEFKKFGGESVKKPVFAVNNYPYRIELQGCGFSGLGAAESDAVLLNDAGGCTVTGAGDVTAVSSSINADTQFDEANAQQLAQLYAGDSVSDVVYDAGDALSWRTCAENYCACPALTGAVAAFEKKFGEDLSLVEPSAYEKLFGTTQFKESVVIKAADFGYDCTAPGVVGEALGKLEKGRIQLLTLQKDILDYLAPVSVSVSPVRSRDKTLEEALSKPWLYATKDGLASDANENTVYTFAQRYTPDAACFVGPLAHSVAKELWGDVADAVTTLGQPVQRNACKGIGGDNAPAVMYTSKQAADDFCGKKRQFFGDYVYYLPVGDWRYNRFYHGFGGTGGGCIFQAKTSEMAPLPEQVTDELTNTVDPFSYGVEYLTGAASALVKDATSAVFGAIGGYYAFSGSIGSMLDSMQALVYSQSLSPGVRANIAGSLADKVSAGSMEAASSDDAVKGVFTGESGTLKSSEMLKLGVEAERIVNDGGALVTRDGKVVLLTKEALRQIEEIGVSEQPVSGVAIGKNIEMAPGKGDVAVVTGYVMPDEKRTVQLELTEVGRRLSPRDMKLRTDSFVNNLHRLQKKKIAGTCDVACLAQFEKEVRRASSYVSPVGKSVDEIIKGAADWEGVSSQRGYSMLTAFNNRLDKITASENLKVLGDIHARPAVEHGEGLEFIALHADNLAKRISAQMDYIKGSNLDPKKEADLLGDLEKMLAGVDEKARMDYAAARSIVHAGAQPPGSRMTVMAGPGGIGSYIYDANEAKRLASMDPGALQSIKADIVKNPREIRAMLANRQLLLQEFQKLSVMHRGLLKMKERLLAPAGALKSSGYALRLSNAYKALKATKGAQVLSKYARPVGSGVKIIGKAFGIASIVYGIAYIPYSVTLKESDISDIASTFNEYNAKKVSVGFTFGESDGKPAQAFVISGMTPVNEAMKEDSDGAQRLYQLGLKDAEEHLVDYVAAFNKQEHAPVQSTTYLTHGDGRMYCDRFGGNKCSAGSTAVSASFNACYKKVLDYCPDVKTSPQQPAMTQTYVPPDECRRQKVEACYAPGEGDYWTGWNCYESGESTLGALGNWALCMDGRVVGNTKTIAG